MTQDALPIDALRGEVEECIDRGPVVVSAPTGSGKSTQVPRWLQSRGRVLVVEPRRVAARSLGTRVAELEGTPTGKGVGWVVRDDVQADARTQVVFVTPGVALRWAASGRLASFETLVLDEFHERGMDLDLLLAMCLDMGKRKEEVPQLLVMSATLAGDRIAAHLGGVHLSGEGRLHPVDVRHLPGAPVLPEAHGLEGRVRAALLSVADVSGDALVFLPGKGEIERCIDVLGGCAQLADAELIPLHGGLTLSQQRAVFHPGSRRRIVLATNVAETSLTIPRIGCVVDSGLVRRTHYRNGRGHLTLLPIAQDSADQRSGRAGRLGPGVAVRLWQPGARLDARTPPELHREDLSPLVLAAAACGLPSPEHLPFLDKPKPHAVDAARKQLLELGVLDESPPHDITQRGRTLFGLPLDAHLGRLLVEAQAQGTLSLALPLCAALSTSRPLLRTRRSAESAELDPHPILDAGCDAVGLVRAVCARRPDREAVDGKAFDEARSALRRFCKAFGVDVGQLRSPPALDAPARRRLADTLLGAWPRCAHVRRRHGKRLGWANGGTELSLGRGSLVDGTSHEVVLVLDSRAFTPKPRRDEIVITAAMPVPTRWVVEAGRGRDRLAEVSKLRGSLVARIERVYAGRVLAIREETPTGVLAREAMVRLILQDGLLGGISKELKLRHARRSLQNRLDGDPPLAPVETWLLARLEEVGVEHPDDLSLLEPDDVMPAALEPWQQDALDRDFPPTLSIGDARYRLDYDVGRKVCTLVQVGGHRKSPPPTRFLPRLLGWRIDWSLKNRVRQLRG